jgi:predicted acylesterase/phospholipase RssA
METKQLKDGTTGHIEPACLPEQTCSNSTGPVEKPVVKPKSGDFDTLVLSGGSIHAIIMLGALQYTDDNYLLKKIHRYIGTSAGAMCGYLLAIGYTPIEIMVHLCTKQMLEKMKNFNVVAMMNGSGATSFSHIQEQLEKMTIEKIGTLITLGDLYHKYGKEFYCITHNLTSDKLEVLSYETYPDMPCLIALRMSANLPFIFDHFKYMGNFYIDGGISNNFPIDIGNEKGIKILGLNIVNSNSNFSQNKDNMLEYIYQLMSIPIKHNVLNNIKYVSDKCTIVTLQPDKTPFFDFSLDTHTKLDMFSNGFAQMKEYWEN